MKVNATHAFELSVLTGILGLLTKKLPEGWNELEYAELLAAVAAGVMSNDSKLASTAAQPRDLLLTTAKFTEVMSELSTKEGGDMNAKDLIGEIIEQVYIVHGGKQAEPCSSQN